MGFRVTWPMLAVMAGLWVTSLRAETITVAAEDDWAPYSSMSADHGGPVGLSPDLVRAAFKTQQIDVRFVVLPFARCLRSTETGVVVGCFNTTRTKGNKDQFYWHATPLFQEELGIFARSDSAAHDLTQKDLEGQTVGVTTGYTYPTELMSNARIVKLSAVSDANLLKMLVARRVDFILLNTMPGYYRIQQQAGLIGKVKRVGVVGLDSFWLSFSKRHPDGKRLSDVFEKGMQTIKANGQYDSMMAAFTHNIKP